MSEHDRMSPVSDLETYAASFDGEPGYLDWAAFGPLSPAVRGELHADAELLGSGRPSSIDLVAARRTEACAAVADLLGARVEEVTLQPSTTYGLMQAVYGARGGVIAGTREFPSITVALTRAADALGGGAGEGPRAQWIDPSDGFVTVDAVRDALTADTVAVAVSLVDYRTGFRADLAGLRDAIGDDRLLIVDAAQGFGVVDADYTAADVVCGSGYTWLRAGRGTGFAWFSPRAQDRIRPVLSGFAGQDAERLGETVLRPAPSARAFTVTAGDELAATRLATAVREVQAAGVSAIEAELAARTQEIILYADEYGVPVLTPRDPARRAGIVTLCPDLQDASALSASLANHGLAFTARGEVVRLSAHVGTGADALRLLADALAAYAAARIR